MGSREVSDALKRIESAFNLPRGWAEEGYRAAEWHRHLDTYDVEDLDEAIAIIIADDSRPPTVQRIREAIGSLSATGRIGGGTYSTGAESCPRCDDGIRYLSSCREKLAYEYVVACSCQAGVIRQGCGCIEGEAALDRIAPGAVGYLTGSRWRMHMNDTEPSSPFFRVLRAEERCATEILERRGRAA